MIKNKELGLEMAENKDEAFWTETKKKLDEEIEHSKRIIEMDGWLLKFVEKKLKGGREK